MSRRAFVAVASYTVVMALWTYGLFDRQASLGDVGLAAALAAAALVQLVIGFALGRWAALFLLLVPVLLALPAGYPDDVGGEPFPLWVGAVVLAPFGAALIALGVASRRLVDRRGR